MPRTSLDMIISTILQRTADEGYCINIFDGGKRKIQIFK